MEAGASSFGCRIRSARGDAKSGGTGLNYAEHAGDLKETAPSEEPASFMRPDATMIGLGEEIYPSEQLEKVTGEAEPCLVVESEAKDAPEEEAPSVVTGLLTILDLPAEDTLCKNPRYLTRQGFGTFFRLGSQLVPLDGVVEIEDLTVATVLNSETRRENVVSKIMF